MKQKRLLIGLTGAFGSGKTSTAKEFRSLGAKVINSDELVRGIYKNRNPLVKRVEKALGLRKFDRKLAAKIVFSNSKKRKALERIVHPFVFKTIRQRLLKWRIGIVVIEMPLLFETGFYRKTDANLVVAAPKEAIQKRLFKKGFSREEIRKRQAAQWPLERKVKKADFIIQNNGSKQELKEKVKMIFKQCSNNLLNDSKRRN